VTTVALILGMLVLPACQQDEQSARPDDLVEYDIKTHSDGSFTFSIRGEAYNEGSTLERVSILLNDPNCPVELISNKLEIDYKDRDVRFNITTELRFKDEASAIEVGYMQYDVFNQHLKNFRDIEVKDFSESTTITGIWSATGSKLETLLTTVTYVARVRLADGSQWVFDLDSLVLTLASLNLEQLTETEDEEE